MGASIVLGIVSGLTTGFLAARFGRTGVAHRGDLALVDLDHPRTIL